MLLLVPYKAITDLKMEIRSFYLELSWYKFDSRTIYDRKQFESTVKVRLFEGV